MVHRRQVNGEELVLGNQGALHLRAMTWFDHSTGSVWSQPLGEAILGPRRGERLELLPVSLTDWRSWRDQQPGTVALDAPGGPSGFQLEGVLLVVELDDEVVGYPFPEVRNRGVVQDEVGGIPVAVVVREEDPGSWAVFARRVGDRTVDLVLRGDVLVDPVSGTSWDAVRGFSRDGPLSNHDLPRLAAFTSFPSDYRNHFPAGEVWGPRERS